MEQVTDPGAQRLLADPAAPVVEAAATYGRQTMKPPAMAVATGCWPGASGAGGLQRSLTRQQQHSLGFDLATKQRAPTRP